MRLWSIHPAYLDPAGLVALWREALLAQKVLAGATKGYRYHPQLERFRGASDPLAAVGTYLWHVGAEAGARGYHFNLSRILWAPAALVDAGGGALGGHEPVGTTERLPVATGQLLFEWRWLRSKLEVRSPKRAENMRTPSGCGAAAHDGGPDDGSWVPDPHPLFCAVPGGVEAWERNRP